MRPIGESIASARHAAWEAHVHEVVGSLDLTVGQTAHLIAGVASYCHQFHPQGLHAKDLRLLVSRALCAIGCIDAAAQLLDSMEPHRRHVTRWLEILSELHHFPRLLPYFSRGIIRPADWAGARLDRMWTLDFGRLVLAEEERHEMVLYRTLRALLDNLYQFWEATSGEGTLGVKGLDRFTIGTGKGLKTEADALVNYMERLLERQAHLRRWATRPMVLRLDL